MMTSKRKVIALLGFAMLGVGAMPTPGAVSVWSISLPLSGRVSVSADAERVAVLSPLIPRSSAVITVYDASGQIIWRVELPKETRSSSVVISPKGDRVWCDYWVWVQSPYKPHEPVKYGGGILCFDTAGKELWRIERAGVADGSPVTSPYGYVEAASSDNKLLCLTSGYENPIGFVILDGQGRIVFDMQPDPKREYSFKRVQMDSNGMYLLISHDADASLIDLRGQEITRMPGHAFDEPGSCLTKSGDYVLLQGLDAIVIPRWPRLPYPKEYPGPEKKYDGTLRGFTIFDRWGAPIAAVGSLEVAPSGYQLRAWPESISGRYIGVGEIGGDKDGLAVLAMSGPDWWVCRLHPLPKGEPPRPRIFERASIPVAADLAAIVRLSADGSRVVMVERMNPPRTPAARGDAPKGDRDRQEPTAQGVVFTVIASSGGVIGRQEVPLPPDLPEETQVIPMSLELSVDGRRTVALLGPVLFYVRFDEH